MEIYIPNENNLIIDETLNNKMKASKNKKIREIKEELCEDPLFCNFGNKKVDCKEIPTQKIKEESLESYNQNEPRLSGQERAVNDSYEIMAQDGSLKEEFGKLLMKEEIKEEYLEDPHPLLDENNETFNSSNENSIPNSSTESFQQNCLQEKMQCSPSYIVQVDLSQSNSETPLCDRVGKFEKSRTTEKHFKCSSCAYQTLRIWDLRRHERTHSGDKPFKCNSCPYQAVHMGYLQKHAKTHQYERIFKCSYCPYKATQRRYLEEHIRKHTGEKPFKCRTCPYQAAQMGSLQKHERTHTGIKPFKCNYCPYQTADGGNLQRHERCHTGEKPFKCISCPYQTVNIRFLQKHESSHMNEKLFECRSCLYRAAQICDLWTHEKSHNK